MPSTPSATAGAPHQASHRRALSASTSAVTSAVARDQFEILYPTIRGFLLSQFAAHSMPQDVMDYFTRVCSPFVPFSKEMAYIRTQSVLTTTPSAARANTGLVSLWSRQLKRLEDDN